MIMIMDLHSLFVLLAFGSLTTAQGSRSSSIEEGIASTPPIVSPMQTVTVHINATKFESESNSWIMNGFKGNVSATLRWCLQPLSMKSEWPKDDNCHFGQVNQPIIVDCVPNSTTKNDFLPDSDTPVAIKIRDTPSYEGFLLLATLVNEEAVDYTIHGYNIRKQLRCGKSVNLTLQAPGTTYDNGILTTIKVSCVSRVLDIFVVIGGLDDKTNESKIYRYSFDSKTHKPKYNDSADLIDKLSPTSRFTKINDSLILISGNCSIHSTSECESAKNVNIGGLNATSSLAEFGKDLVPIDSLKNGSYDHYVFVDGRFLILCGGISGKKTNDECYQLDMGLGESELNSTWKSWKNMAHARNRLSGVNFNGELFVISGNNGKLFDSTMEYIEPAYINRKWTLFGPTSQQPFPDQALMDSALISNKQIMMCGGIDTTAVNDTATQNTVSNHCFTLYNGNKGPSIDDSLGIFLNEPRKQGGLLHTGVGLLAFGGGTNSFEYYNATGQWNVIEGVIMNGTAPSQFGVIAWYRDV